MHEIITLPCGNVNCYLLVYGDSAALIDTGRKKYRDYLYNRLKDYNVKLIILTHGHNDHIANAAYLAAKFNSKIAMHYDDYKLSKDNSINNIYCNSLYGNVFKFLSTKDLKRHDIEIFEPDIFLKDGDSLNDYGIEGRIIHIPGHTKGSIGVLLEDGTLIAGDTFVNIFRPSEAVLAEDIDMLNKSIKKLMEMNLKIVYPGHGRAITSIKVDII